jgi:hypothetical protein
VGAADSQSLAGHHDHAVDRDAAASPGQASRVGVTDGLQSDLDLLPFGPNTSNPCPIAQKVAEAMIHHLQGPPEHGSGHGRAVVLPLGECLG